MQKNFVTEMRTTLRQCLAAATALLLASALPSCTEEKKKPVFIDVGDTYEESGSDEVAYDVAVPFRNDNGVKYVQVTVNGVGFEMIFDTGCSGALISMAEANYLYQKGKLTADDILGVAHSQIADGSIVENMVVNLREVVINGQIACPNVQATVSANINAPLLLGNAVLDRLATITIDNENETLNFKLK